MRYYKNIDGISYGSCEYEMKADDWQEITEEEYLEATKVEEIKYMNNLIFLKYLNRFDTILW